MHKKHMFMWEVSGEPETAGQVLQSQCQAAYGPKEKEERKMLDLWPGKLQS